VRRLSLLLVALLGCTPELLVPDAGPSLDGGGGSDVGVDAGPADVGAADVGFVDAAPTDADVEDAAEPDAGEVDAGAPDGGATPDAGPTTCEVVGVDFTCVEVSACAGTPLLGRCGDLPEVCCQDTPPCSVDGAPGVCMDTAQCPGVSTPGRCPGAVNIQCCTFPTEACDENTTPTPNPSRAEVSLDPRCPDGMVHAGTFCVDAFEASLVRVADGSPWSPYANPGGTAVRAVSVAYAVPQGYISGQQAGAACTAAGKRLCTDVEWLAACQGPGQLTYPYGNTREDGRCNDARDRHPAYEYFGTTDPSVFNMLDHPCINQLPAGLGLTGQYAGCESSVGAFDMMGNLHEWTSDPAGTFRGGYYVDTRINGNGCLYRTTAHGASYWDYSTGFRCCADPN